MLKALALCAIATLLATHVTATSVLIHLKSAHSEEQVERAFMDRADPDSPLFRKHMSQTELTALVGAKVDSIVSVGKWLDQLSVGDARHHQLPRHRPVRARRCAEHDR